MRVVVGAEAVMRAERVGDGGQRLAEMLGHLLRVGHVVRHFAQPVHVVGEAQEPRRHLVTGEEAEGRAHHARARHLAERADMGQAGRAVAGLEQDAVRAFPLQAQGQLPGLLEGPGGGLLCGFYQ